MAAQTRMLAALDLISALASSPPSKKFTASASPSSSKLMIVQRSTGFSRTAVTPTSSGIHKQVMLAAPIHI
jgi:hypothetical protein